jgi:glycosyltransferase involved in cell wall biosynthesis
MVAELSVIVCSFNRRDKLCNLLLSLVRAGAQSRVSWEVVVVDNASDDGTEAAVRSLSQQYPTVIRYIYEPRRGKSYALNSGLSAAQGSIVAFTDSDILVAPDWLASIQSEFAGDAALDVLGGRVELNSSADSPIAVRRLLKRKQITLDEFHVENIPIIGCNMTLRRSAIERVGLFDTLMGPGTPVASGDDTDYLYRAIRAGLTIMYVPEVVVYHDHGRSSEQEMARTRRAYVVSRGAFYSKYAIRRDRVATKWAYWELRCLLRDALRFAVGSSGSGSRFSALRLIYQLMVGALIYRWQRLWQKAEVASPAPGTT